jgi:hypothetical protein
VSVTSVLKLFLIMKQKSNTASVSFMVLMVCHYKYCLLYDWCCVCFPVDTSNSNPDSGPNSPPSVANAQASPTAGRNTPIQEVRSPLHSLEYWCIKIMKRKLCFSMQLQNFYSQAKKVYRWLLKQCFVKMTHKAKRNIVYLRYQNHLCSQT